jgi:hypothetical protein
LLARGGAALGRALDSAQKKAVGPRSSTPASCCLTTRADKSVSDHRRARRTCRRRSTRFKSWSCV